MSGKEGLLWLYELVDFGRSFGGMMVVVLGLFNLSWGCMEGQLAGLECNKKTLKRMGMIDF